MYKVVLSGGSPWGFRLEDGAEAPGKTARSVQIAKLNVNSKAHEQGIQIGDAVHSINGQSVAGMSSAEVMQLVRRSDDTLSLELIRGIPTSDDSDIYSSGYSSKGSNRYTSWSTLSSTSFNNDITSNTASDYPLNKEEKISRPLTIGQECVKSYRPVLFNVSNGVSSRNAGEKLASNTRASPQLVSGNDINLHRTNLSTSSTFSLKADDVDRDMGHWHSEKSQSTTESFPTSVSCSADSSLFSSRVPTSSPGSPDSNQLQIRSFSSNGSRLPVVQNPTITLLQKKRVDGQIQRSASPDDGPSDRNRIESKFLLRQSLDSDLFDNKSSKNVFHKYQNSDPSMPMNREKENSNHSNQSRVTGLGDSSDRFGVKTVEAVVERPENSYSGNSASEVSDLQKFSQQSVEKPSIQPSHRYTGSGSGRDLETDDADAERRIVKFEGIGPVDEKTGIPIATRSSLDLRNQKDWYRHMYKSMHKSDQAQESSFVFPGKDESYDKDRIRRKSAYDMSFTIRKATPDERYASTPSLADAGIETNKDTLASKPAVSKSFASSLANSNSRASTNQPSPSSLESSDDKISRLSLSPRNLAVKNSRLSPSPAIGTAKSGQFSAPSSPRKKTNDSWTVANYKYGNQPYKVQPRRIEDYEPGHSSALLSESEKLHSSISDIPGRENSKFRPFWKSTSSLDQESSGKIEKESVRLNVGASRQNTWTPTVVAPLAKEDVSNVGLKEKPNFFSHFQPETKDGHLRSRSYSYSSNNNSDNWTRGLETSQKLQNNSRSDDGPGKQSHSTGPVHLQNSRNNNGGPITSAKVLHTFRAQSPTDLSIYEGETVYIFHHIDKNWCEGESNGKIGKFPINFVKIQSMSGEEQNQSDSQNLGRAIALYDFNAQTSLELSFRKNEELVLISQINDDWFEGLIGNQSGFVPANFIKVIKEPDSSSSPKKILPSQRQDNFSSSLINDQTISSSSSVPQNLKNWPDSASRGNSFSGTMSTTAKSGSSAQLFPNQARSYNEESETQKTNSVSSDNNRFTSNLSSQYGINSGEPFASASSRTTNHPFKPATNSTSGAEKSSLYFSVADRSSNPSDFHNLDSSSKFNSGVGKVGSVQTATVWPTYKTSHVNGSHRPDGNMFGNSKFVAVYAYKPRRADELELNKGDIVYVMEKYDDGWFVGMSERTKKMGTFPGNYVEALS